MDYQRPLKPRFQVGLPWPGETEVERDTPAYELNLNLAEAREYEELHAITRDLEFVIYIATVLFNQLSQQEEQQPDDQGRTVAVGTAGNIARALYTAALVAYVRCFTEGKRKQKLSVEIFSGEAEYLKEWHEYFKATRDKHVTHSVNPFEINRALAFVAGMDSDDPEVRAVMAFHSPFAYDSAEGIDRLVKLASYAQVIAHGRMRKAEGKLDEKVRQLPKDKLRRLKPVRIEPEKGVEAARTPRP